MIERDAFDGHVAAMFLGQQLDLVVAFQRLERLHLEQRDLASLLRLVGVESCFVADEISIALDTAPSDELERGKRAHRQKGARGLVQEANDALPRHRDLWLIDCDRVHRVFSLGLNPGLVQRKAASDLSSVWRTSDRTSMTTAPLVVIASATVPGARSASSMTKPVASKARAKAAKSGFERSVPYGRSG